ncbi:hypothetical protein PgNI_05390 [Pyricularia grisea]|uniref:Uncharacterized protein n=1 Tax=Pyricularia grisea TaxID=148305 RepID=A0A6P8B6S3_PYRGI|nr:hypothetical protein PgNI_05390 [Pyricularia grisea]TLD10963.1 hypothetical protein PgNI_05390 [Pyricularia grisea]
MSSSRPWIEVARSVPTNVCPKVGAVLVWASAAATQISEPCMRKSRARLDLRSGPRRREMREKTKHPSQKEAMDARHLIHSLGSSAGMPAVPRARKSVLPWMARQTMDTKTLAPENATLSQIPDTEQHARIGMSAWVRVTSCCNLASQD